MGDNRVKSHWEPRDWLVVFGRLDHGFRATCQKETLVASFPATRSARSGNSDAPAAIAFTSPEPSDHLQTLMGLGVPQSNRMVMRGTYDPPAIRAVRDDRDTQSSCPRKTANLTPLSASQTRTVLSCDPLAIRATVRGIAHAIYRLFMSAQDGQPSTAFGVPHPYRIVLRRTYDPPTIRTVQYTLDRVFMSAQDGQLGTAFGVPHAYRLVTRATRDPLAVWAVRDGLDIGLCPRRIDQLGAAFGVPHPHRIVL